ncbi:MAG: DUF5688 family protein [Agathobacter sp.]
MAKLAYSEFLKIVSGEFLSYFPETWQEAEVTVQMVQKNRRSLDGLTILRTGRGSDISPTVYIQDMYKYYLDNLPDPVDATLSHFASLYMTAYRRAKTNGATGENVTARLSSAPVIPCVVAREGNEEFLAGKVWRPFLDMAVYYRLVLNTDGSGMASVAVTENLLQTLSLTKEELDRKALATLSGGMKPVVMGMADMIYNTIPEPFRPDWEEFEKNFPDTGMLVVTNQHKLNGAAEMLNTGLLGSIAEEAGCDLYILPSSVHELIIVKEENFGDPQALREMVRDVNGNPDVIRPEDILTDSVYCYSRERGTVEVA